MAEYVPLACSSPVRIAAPLPRFFACRTSSTPSGSDASASHSRVPSVEPSSMITSCRVATGSSAPSASAIAASIVGRSLKTGIRIVSESGGRVTTGGYAIRRHRSRTTLAPCHFSRSSSGARSARSRGRTSAIRPRRSSPRGCGRGRCGRTTSPEPTVTVIIPAYNEEAVIERRLENLLELDYPAEKLEIVVASDASTRPHQRARRRRSPRASRGCSLLECPRGGKVAAQDRAVRQATSRGRRVLRRRTRPGRPTPSGSSSRTSPIPRSPTSAGSCGSRRRPARTARAPTGATR